MDASAVPPGVDPSSPSPARVYDYALGGSQNFAIDRQVLDKITEIFPSTPQPARENRAFLRRAVRFCLDQGIRQFLDLGSGVPTVGNVHEIAHETDPAARVVYVEIDPIAAAHGRRLLDELDTTTVLQEDMRDTQRILGHSEVARLLDFTQPVAVLMVAMAHYLKPTDGPAAVLTAYRDVMTPGSYLVFSHMTGDDFPDEMDQAVAIFNADASDRDAMVLRSRSEITDLLTGFDLLEPGVVHPSQWRPDSAPPPGHDPRNSNFYAAVATPR